jgi:putative N6-adenine-specific DNA methylase
MSDYLYQRRNAYFAQVAGGMEELAVEELQSLGADGFRIAYRGLQFQADQATLYRINYRSRLITRVLAPLITFGCYDTRYLYQKAREINWADFINTNQTLAVFANVTDSKITHSKYAALCVKDAIVDQFWEKTGMRPNIDTHEPDLWVNLYLERNRATLSIDTSGGSLHRRAYRKRSVQAPMQETLAAAILYLSGWDGTVPIYDPMCGSGTLLCEAAMHYCNIPAAYLRRKFGFEKLPDFAPQTWQKIRQSTDSQIRSLPSGIIAGSDRELRAVRAARENLLQLPGMESVELQVKDFRQLKDLNNRVIVSNPPYGVRLGELEKLKILMKEFGDFLKHECTGSNAYIYFGNRELLKFIGLRTSWKKALVNGDLDGRLAKFELY